MNAPANARIVLHLGAPKTGSTYIQQRLSANADALPARGARYPKIARFAPMAGNAKSLAVALNGFATATFARVFPQIDPAQMDAGELMSELLAPWRKGETLLLSAEDLRPDHAAALMALLPPGCEVRPVLLVRRQDAWAASYFNQLWKSANLTLPLDVFVDRLVGAEDSRLCQPDWLAWFKAWRGAFGECRVLIYEAVRERLFEAFLEAADLSDLEDLPDVPAVQESVDIFTLASLLELPPETPYEALVARREAARARSASLGLERDVRSPFSAAHLARIRTRFGDGAVALASAIGRPEAAPLLDLAVGGPEPFDLAAFRASAPYRAFRKGLEPAAAAWPSAPAAAPITFVTVVDDEGEFAHNLAASAVFRAPHAQWIVIRNDRNRRSAHLTPLYREGLAQARHDLVVFVHPDVFLPEEWEQRFHAGLDELAEIDPDWGVVGIAGALPLGAAEAGRGHWADPRVPEGLFLGPLPAEVFALDECLLAIRKGSGLNFDPRLAGFHCYGVDLCLAARQAGLRAWAIDAPLRHKLKDSLGAEIASASASSKIAARDGPAFAAAYALSRDYVRRKWAAHLPMRDMSGIYEPLETGETAPSGP